MKIAIVDDEEVWLKEEQLCIENYYNKEDIQIDTYLSGEAFLESNVYYDVVLMDIELGEGREDGFSISEKYQRIKRDVVLIIMTTHIEFSRKGYQVNAFRYIDKTCMEEELQEALNSAENRLVQNRFIEVHMNGMGMQKVYCKNIVYIESNNNTAIINTETEKLICRETLKSLYKKLQDKGFFQLHRVYVVNLEQIQKFEEKNIYLKNGITLMITKSRYKKFEAYYFQWKMKRANM